MFKYTIELIRTVFVVWKHKLSSSTERFLEIELEVFPVVCQCCESSSRNQFRNWSTAFSFLPSFLSFFFFRCCFFLFFMSRTITFMLAPIRTDSKWFQITLLSTTNERTCSSRQDGSCSICRQSSVLLKNDILLHFRAIQKLLMIIESAQKSHPRPKRLLLKKHRDHRILHLEKSMFTLRRIAFDDVDLPLPSSSSFLPFLPTSLPPSLPTYLPTSLPPPRLCFRWLSSILNTNLKTNTKRAN